MSDKILKNTSHDIKKPLKQSLTDCDVIIDGVEFKYFYEKETGRIYAEVTISE